MVSVIATIVLLLALASITLGQTHNQVADCLDGVADAGGVCTVDVCMVVSPAEKHHKRLFIIEEKYGYECMADGEAASASFKMRLTTCFATISDTHYQAFSDAALNDLRSLAENKGPDDDKEVWNICDYLINNPGEWKVYQKVKAEEGSFASLYSADIRSVYTVTTTAGADTKVASLKFNAIGGATDYTLNTIPDHIKFLDVTCKDGVSETADIVGGSHFVEGTAVYTCEGVQNPVLLGCLTVMPAVPGDQSTISNAQLTYITIATVKQLKQVYFGTGFASATNRPLDDIAKMSNKTLCAGISDEYMNNKNLFDQLSPYTPNPKAPAEVTNVPTWFVPKFYVSDDPAV